MHNSIMSNKKYTLEFWQGPPETMQSLGYGPLFTGSITVESDIETDDSSLILSSNWENDKFLGVKKSISTDPTDIEENLIKGYTNTGYYKCIPVTNKIKNGVFIDNGLTLDVRKFYYPSQEFTYAPQIKIADMKEQEQLEMNFYNGPNLDAFHLPKYYNYPDGSKVPCSISYINLVGDTKVEGGITGYIYCWNNDDSYAAYGFDNCTIIIKGAASQSTSQSLLNSTRMKNYIIPTVLASGLAVVTFYLVQKLMNNNNKSRVGSINKNVTFTQSYIPKVITNDGVPKNLLSRETNFPGSIKFL